MDSDMYLKQAAVQAQCDKDATSDTKHSRSRASTPTQTDGQIIIPMETVMVLMDNKCHQILELI